MKIASCLLTVLFLAACSQPDVITRSQEVDLPVAQGCHVTIQPAPTWKVPDAMNASYALKVRAMAEDLDAAKAYIIIQKAALDGCQS